MIIGVGTTSDLKLRAVRSALKDLGVHAEVVPYTASSGVGEQPFSYEEIVNGAKNRAMQTASGIQNAELVIGIENGLIYIPEAKRYYDIPAIHIMQIADRKSSVAFGMGIYVPEVFVGRIKNDQIDLGILIQSLNNGGEKDPVNYFFRGLLKREEILKQAIISAFGEIIYPEQYKL